MGSALQRLEVLTIGLIVLIAGAVVAAGMWGRPSSPIAAAQLTPQPITPQVALPALTTPAPHALDATLTPSSAVAIASGEPARGITLPGLPIRSIPWAVGPMVLTAGALIAWRLRRRRMPYTNQSVGQLLATADATTRSDNLKIMQRLAAQGLLSDELAAAAGIDRARPRTRRAVALPRMHLPALRLPHVRLPRLRLPRRVRRAIPSEPASNASAPPSAPAPAFVAPAAVDASAQSPGDAPAVALPLSALPPITAPVSEPESGDLRSAGGERWTAEDRALVVAGSIAQIWAEAGATRAHASQSQLVAFDTADTPGDGQVIVTIDGHPDEEAQLLALPDALTQRHPRWRAAWQQDTLEVLVADAAPPPTGGPLLVPILTHGRGGKTIRYIPLAAWPHLGLYGGSALQALHALLGSLLYAQPPAALALAIIDQGEIAPLYRNVAHLVALPASPGATIDRLMRAIRWSAAVRPLVLVIVEPDDHMLNLLCDLAVRLQARPAPPVHLIVVQECLRAAGRELYALLPALITSGGHGSTALLPGQGLWPKPGAARLVGRGMRVEGRARTLADAALVGLLAELRGQPRDLLPVLWEVPVPGGVPVRAEHATRQPGAAVEPAATESPIDAEDSAATGGAPSVSATPPVSRGAALLHAACEAGKAAMPFPSLGAQRVAAVEVPPAPGVESRATRAAAQPAAPVLAAEPDNGFPAGPTPLGRVALAELLARLLATPAIVAGQAQEQGVTKNRLAELFKGYQKAQAKELAEVLMAWLDLAGLLVEPTRPGRLRHPRALSTTSLAEIAAKLSATPCPDAQTVQALWAESSEGRS